MHKSDFADDPDMTELIEGYVQRLPGEVAKLHAMLGAPDLESLRRVAHQLKGSGGGYGFGQITALAAIVDGSIKRGETLDNVRRQVDDLVAYLRNVAGYVRDLENAPQRAAD